MKKQLLCLLFFSLLPALMFAQSITTAEFSGTVLSNENLPMPGVTIKAVHVPTGTVFTTITRDDGRFNIPAVRVGGPYTVTASLEGFKDETIDSVFVKLGENKQFTFTLNLANVDLGEVTVVATDDVLSLARTGAAQNVTEAAIDNMPSITRNFSDFARLVPQVNISENFSEAAYSVAGRNNRYNNVQIDGAVNNDVFGLADSGSPGGQAGTTPISLDAIQEFQIVLAPYDVRQGGFTGGGINAITRGGTNSFHGSAFFYYRNQDFVGNGPDDTEYGEFSDKQMGFRLGGPIVKDRVFFFVNGEFTRRGQPVDFVIDDSGSSNDFGGNSVSVADAERFTQICNSYGYDPGSYGEVSNNRDSNKFFGRGDININKDHRLTVRFNFVDATNDILSRSGGSFGFGNNGYTFANRTYSLVGQLDSIFAGNFANELRINYTAIRDSRDVPSLFPNVSVGVNGYYLYAGTERYSGANGLDQDIIEITDNVTWFMGKHTLVLGTHNEFFDFGNLFIRDITGTYQFSNLDNFAIGKASRYEYSYSNVAGEPRWWAQFGVAQLGFYVGDTYAIRPNVSLTFGLRMDVPIIGEKPSYNARTEEIFGYRTDEVATGNILWSPRLGFNWDVFQDQKTIVRGGVGIFSGRTPYVWISNQFSNTGIEFTRYDIRSNVPTFVPDPDNQPKGFASASNEVDVMDPDFKFPQVVRTDFGVDRELPYGMKATFELLWSKNLSEVLYQNPNLVKSGNDPIDLRPLYKNRKDSTLTDLIYLTNTDAGYQYSLSFQLQKNFGKGAWINGSYTYGEAKDVNSATSSQARSSFQYNHISGDPNAPYLTASNQDIRHRIALGASYTLNFIPVAPTTLSIFYNGRSGRPYSTRYTNDLNGDGSQYNDCIYVPASADEVIVTGGTWDDLNTYISGDPGLNDARGTVVWRNASYEPWYHRVDFRLLQDVNIPKLEGHKFQFSLDIMNFLNLFNSDWGKYEYVYYRGDSPLTNNGVDAATGKQKIGFNRSNQRRYDMDQLLSRWQMQIGFRYIF